MKKSPLHKQVPVSGESAAVVRNILELMTPGGGVALSNTSTGAVMVVPPEVVPLVRDLLTLVAAGKTVVLADLAAEITPNEAAELLGVSRMLVMKLVQEGTLPHRMVGNHHRIPYDAVYAYKEGALGKQRAAMEEIYAIDREGPVDDAPLDKSDYRSGGRGE